MDAARPGPTVHEIALLKTDQLALTHTLLRVAVVPVWNLALQHEQQPIFPKEQLIVILSPLKRLVGPFIRGLRVRFLQWTAPLTSCLPLATVSGQ